MSPPRCFKQYHYYIMPRTLAQRSLTSVTDIIALPGICILSLLYGGLINITVF